MPLPEDVPDYAVYLIGETFIVVAFSSNFPPPGHLGGAAQADIALDGINFLSSACDCELQNMILLCKILFSVTPSEAAHAQSQI